MIDTKDLMIGNWVEVKSQVKEQCDFKRINGIVDRNHFYLLYEGDKYNYRVDSANPIPVTPELLERIGFISEDNPCGFKEWSYFKEREYSLRVNDQYSNSYGRDWYIHIDNDHFSTIGSGCFGYLHELQNLVRVITGHDLPITKEMLG